MRARSWSRVAAILMAAFLSAGCSGGERAQEQARRPEVDGELVSELVAYVTDNHRTPEEYIVGKFGSHDIVFVGEYHRIRHDAELVAGMIPGLYEAGVRSLGMEFARRADQADIDLLVTADEYDDVLAREMLWREWPWWGFKEYADIFRAAWQFNSALPDGAPPFRVFGLNATQDWSHVWSEEDRRDPETARKVWPEGDSDEVMAATILSEFVEKGEKALIYSGINHAYTEYRQPIVDGSTGEFLRFNGGRMGNRVFDEIGKRCVTVFLHSPWPPAENYSAPWVLAADGVVDAVIEALPGELRRAGFDVSGTPFATLGGETGWWKHGYDGFTLADYCDGYVIQGPLYDYEGVSLIDGWFTEDNRVEAIEQLANPEPRVKNLERSIESMTRGMASDTDMERHFGHLW